MRVGTPHPPSVAGYGIRDGAPYLPSAGRCGIHELASRLAIEYRALTESAQKEFRDEGWKGRLNLKRSADLRYRGQGFELNVPFGPRMLESFHNEHKRRYGYSNPDRDVEIVTIRLRATIVGYSSGRIAAESLREESQSAKVWFEGKFRETVIIARESLLSNKRYRGPAIVTEYSSTTVVPPGATFQLDRVANLVIGLKSNVTRRSR
jgi:N-methylhydantoinase A